MSTNLSYIRKRMLRERGIIGMEKHTRRLIRKIPHKSDRMRYLESKYNCKLEEVLAKGSLSDIVQFFQGEVDRSTISRWRKMVTG